ASEIGDPAVTGPMPPIVNSWPPHSRAQASPIPPAPRAETARVNSGAGDRAPRSGPARETGRRRGGSASKLDPDELAALEDERDFLLESLRDLDAEFESGDLDEEDHEALRDEYTARAAETLRAIRDRRRAFEEAKQPRSVGRT